ncbi:sensor histidine kinase [Nocardioides sediminis]|uniref:sensor histidine kinase n=1 Tax=Nocardioides sediminis TaxID=433648 RepID=UPI000D3005F4|nr:histidine kinase [Nocardioides sediminis]
MDHPTPEEIQPPLTWRSQAWRLAVCALISGLVWSQAIEGELESRPVLFWVEILFGLASYVLVVRRRRAPVTIALVVAGLSTFSGIAAGPATLAAVSVATRRVAWSVVVVGLVNFVAATTYTFYAPIELRDPLWVTVLINAVVNAAMMGWGLYIGSRRELIWTLRQRAARAEAEQELRVSQARGTERERIAREMHDVLAHRITQVSMHSGALAFRDDLAADELREGLTQIQGKANEALHELRGVLGVLRDASGQPVDEPQPRFADINEMVAEARSSGMHVTYDDRVVQDAEPVPDAAGRTIYRIVQEGLTNASKHAPGAHVAVEVSGEPEGGLEVTVRNPVGFRAPGAPGAGLGLVGLAERAELRGGRLEHGREGALFVLRGWIPWTA